MVKGEAGGDTKCTGKTVTGSTALEIEDRGEKKSEVMGELSL